MNQQVFLAGEEVVVSGHSGIPVKSQWPDIEEAALGVLVITVPVGLASFGFRIVVGAGKNASTILLPLDQIDFILNCLSRLECGRNGG